MTAVVCPADPVGRTSPPIYAEKLAGELTPLEPLLDAVDYFSPEESDHGSILQEDIVYLLEDGRSYELKQYAYKALSDGNLDNVGMDVFYFRPETEKIYLLKAETILPDGSRHEVPDEGILIQTPKSDRGSLIFSGRKQMRLIYPKVAKGSVTHCIVLVEKSESRIPGQFTDRFSWERSWQTHMKRVVLDLPEAERKRLKIVTYGSGVPAAVESEQPGGRSHLEWVRKKLPVRTSEKCDGPLLQTGPYLCLSTMADWNEFAAWYAGRIRESSKMTDEVRAVAEEWADGATDEDEIIHNLAFRVANDIRYVSLEFRVGGLVPQAGASVLKNRFGDCKDKSNFLRMLLKAHGIRSHVMLINTDHAGHVEKRSPDYAYFDHAILLIEKSNGEKVICDPTIKYGSAGMRYPGIGDRPALVIDEESSTCRWEQMPPASGGLLDYGWDLKLAGSGELSGWFTIKAEGFYASSMSERFESTNTDRLKYEVERYLGYFYNAASVMDYEIERATADQQRFSLKAYFVRPASGQAEQTVSWPDIRWLLPRLGEKKEVVREAFTWPKDIRVSMKLALPASTTVTSVPNDWKVKTRGFDAEGAWQRTDDGLRADFSFKVTDANYAPQAFAKLFTAVDASSHWTEKLAILGEGAPPPAGEKAADTDTELGDEFVLLSTGKGQLNLVDHLYPLNSKPKQRRLALEKTKAWFPKDNATQYECEIRLAWLAYSDKAYDQCLKIIADAGREYGDAVGKDTLSWGEYLKAMALEEVDRKEEAMSIFRELEANEELNEFRRGYAAYQYARMLVPDDPARAKEYYLKALGYNSGNERWMLEQSLVFLLKQASVQELADYLARMKVEQAEKAQSITQWLAEIGIANAKKLNGMQMASRINGMISALDFASSVLEEEQISRLKELDTDYRNYLKCREEIQAHLEAADYSVWKGKPEKERTFKEYTDDIKKAIDDDKIDESCYLALARICFFSVEIEFPQWIWDAARMVDYLCKNGQRDLEPLRTVLFEARRYLPPKNDGTIDLDFIRAESLEREGHPREALAIYQQLNDLKLEQRWLQALYIRWTKLLISEGELEQAIEVCSQSRAYVEEDEDFLPLTVLGIYALLQTDQKDEAMVWVDGLQSEYHRLKLDNEHTQRLDAWADLEESGQLEEFWAFYKTWWPKWEAVRTALDLPTNNPPASVDFLDPESAGEELGAAIRDKDYSTLANVLDQLIISARWHPYMCKEAQGIMTYLVQHFEDAKTELQQCTVAMNCEQFLTDKEVQYSARTDTLRALLGLDEYEELMTLAESYYQDTTNEVHRSMYSRFGGLAAVNLERPGTAWLGRMEEQLRKPDQQNDPYAVNIMSRLYYVESRFEDERDLLKDYLTNHRVDNKTMNELLEGRLKDLLELMNGNEQLTKAVADWSEKYQPAWIAVFPDAGTKEQSTADVTRTVEDLLKSGTRPKLAQCAYLYHAAEDGRLSSTLREDAFYKFLGYAVDPVWRIDRALSMIEAVANDERFSESLRRRAANYASNLAYVFSVPGYVDEKFVPCMKKLGLEDQLDKVIEIKAEFCNRNALSAASVSGWMDRAEAELQPFSRHTAYLMNLAFSDLCEIGDMDVIQKQLTNAKKFRFESNSGNSAFSVQLKWRKQADQLKELMPIHRAFEAFFRSGLKEQYALPAYRDVLAYRAKGLREQRDLFRAMLQHGVYDHTSLSFWGRLNDLEYLNGRILVDSSNLNALLDQVMPACEKDRQYAAALDVVQQLFDTDDAECLRIYFARTKGLTLKSGMERTKQEILSFRYRTRIRGGDYKQALADLESEQGLSKRQRHIELLKALTMEHNNEAINGYLNSADTDLLLDDGLIVQTLHAYKLAGNEAAYELVKEEAQKVFREFKARALQRGDEHSVYFSVLLAENLGAKEDLDQNWVDAVRAICREDVAQHLMMKLSNMKADWAGTESAARALAKLKPSHYDTFYYLGKSQIKQGKYAEGLKSMEPFLRYCLDSNYYEDALELQKFAKAQTGK